MLKGRNMMDIKMILLQWFIIFMITNVQVEQLEVRIFQTKNKRKNYTNELLENLIKEKYNQF